MIRGCRKFDGRYFMLAGRGTKEDCQREATQARKDWRYVRVVPWDPFMKKHLQVAIDDYAIFVFEKRRA